MQEFHVTWCRQNRGSDATRSWRKKPIGCAMQPLQPLRRQRFLQCWHWYQRKQRQRRPRADEVEALVEDDARADAELQ